MAAEVTSQVPYNCVPNCNESVYILTYTKVNAGDTMAIATYTPLKTIRYIKAVIDADGTADPVTWSGTTVTFSTGTGLGRMIIIGECK